MNQEPVSDQTLHALLEKISNTPIPHRTIEEEMGYISKTINVLMWNPDNNLKEDAQAVDTERGVNEVSEMVSPSLTILDLIAEQRHSYEETAAERLSEAYCLAAIDTVLKQKPDLVQTLLLQAQKYAKDVFDETPTQAMDLMYRVADTKENSGPFEAVKEYLNYLMLTSGIMKRLDASLQKK